jgi:hypothetical protein
LLFFASAIAISTSAAQTPGVTDDSILIGSCSALDGPVRFLQNQTVPGCDNLSTFHERRRRGFRPYSAVARLRRWVEPGQGSGVFQTDDVFGKAVLDGVKLALRNTTRLQLR